MNSHVLKRVTNGLVLLVTIYLIHCKAENIVFFLTHSTYSHRVSMWPLVEALAEEGHCVTFISATVGRNDTSHKLVKEVFLPDVKSVVDGNVGRIDFVSTLGFPPPSFPFQDFLHYILCRSLHLDRNFKMWFKQNKNSTVDLVVSDIPAECSYGLTKSFNAKHVVFNVLPYFPFSLEAYGIPHEPSGALLPDWYSGTLPKYKKLTFLQRIYNTMVPLISRAIQVLLYNTLYGSLFTENGLSFAYPNIYEMERNTALYFTNSDHLTDYPRSLPPFVVNLPGLHLSRERKLKFLADRKLENDLDEFISNQKYIGIIYISFGTFIDGSKILSIPRQLIQEVIKATPTLGFVWVTSQKLKEIPSNLIVTEWTNQPAVLARKEVKGFITQGGRPSLQEAFYNGVPTICIPVFAEQYYNGYNYARLGTSIVLEPTSISLEKINSSIYQMVWGSRLRSKANKMAKLGNDHRPNSLEKAVWWIHFVLQHTTMELNLLKPKSQTLNWIQKRELDVWIFIFFLIAFCFVFLAKCLSVYKVILH